MIAIKPSGLKSWEGSITLSLSHFHFHIFTLSHFHFCTFRAWSQSSQAVWKAGKARSHSAFAPLASFSAFPLAQRWGINVTLNMMMKMFKMAFVECVDSDEKYKDIIPMSMPTKTMILVNMTTHRCSDTRLEVFVLFCWVWQLLQYQTTRLKLLF